MHIVGKHAAIIVDVRPAIYEHPVLWTQGPNQEAAPRVLVEQTRRNRVPAKVLNCPGRIRFGHSVIEFRPGGHERHHNR